MQQKQTEIITTPQFLLLLLESAREDPLCIHPIRHGKESPERHPVEAATGGTDLPREDSAELLPLGSIGPGNTIPTGRTLAFQIALREMHPPTESTALEHKAWGLQKAGQHLPPYHCHQQNIFPTQALNQKFIYTEPVSPLVPPSLEKKHKGGSLGTGRHHSLAGSHCFGRAHRKLNACTQSAGQVGF